ncbi:putative Phage prohead protease, HK97 family [Magnetospirillum sp. XM-1]|uniref:HK97 family phage prohead protease n=1 Tax=Magnetospirillum sp. XM-1 TaxID=1663591 RepID=UPI00073DCBF7|nr:HK97 family phage prohead protease [Magnetospirillum sp. XM-1]CUW39290.1 putative Phage prohead protease, HK97 family [Magnetospirillum sp. XM-1]
MSGANIERRALVMEIRAAGRRLEGYAATFGTEARIADFTEVIQPGAFHGSLSPTRDVLALVDHDPSKVLARTRSGTLRLSEDPRGLSFSLDLPDTQAGRDVLALAERGDLGGMSFGFTVPQDGERWQGNRRELRSVLLHEISVVSAWPAYSGTSVQARFATPRLAHAIRFLETCR